MVGDWDGDGQDEIGLYLKRAFYVDYNANGFSITEQAILFVSFQTVVVDADSTHVVGSTADGSTASAGLT